MARHRHDDDDDRILRDGESVRVPMMLRDALPRAAAGHDAAPPLVVDSFGDSGLALHRPGARYLAAPSPRTVDHAVQVTLAHMRDEAYAAAEQQMRDAWKSPGHEIDVPPAISLTGDAREDAYRAREAADQQMRDAWRGPRNSGKWPMGSGR